MYCDGNTRQAWTHRITLTKSEEMIEEISFNTTASSAPEAAGSRTEVHRPLTHPGMVYHPGAATESLSQDYT